MHSVLSDAAGIEVTRMLDLRDVSARIEPEERPSCVKDREAGNPIGYGRRTLPRDWQPPQRRRAPGSNRAVDHFFEAPANPPQAEPKGSPQDRYRNGAPQHRAAFVNRWLAAIIVVTGFDRGGRQRPPQFEKSPAGERSRAASAAALSIPRQIAFGRYDCSRALGKLPKAMTAPCTSSPTQEGPWAGQSE